jgi:hypothetical protein
MTTRFQDSIAFTAIANVAAAYVVKEADVVLLVNTAAARTISTDLTTHVEGRMLMIKDSAGTGAATNNITFDPAGGVLVDGGATKVINTLRGSLLLIFAGGAWHSI